MGAWVWSGIWAKRDGQGGQSVGGGVAGEELGGGCSRQPGQPSWVLDLVLEVSSRLLSSGMAGHKPLAQP